MRLKYPKPLLELVRAKAGEIRCGVHDEPAVFTMNSAKSKIEVKCCCQAFRKEITELVEKIELKYLQDQTKLLNKRNP